MSAGRGATQLTAAILWQRQGLHQRGAYCVLCRKPCWEKVVKRAGARTQFYISGLFEKNNVIGVIKIQVTLFKDKGKVHVRRSDMAETIIRILKGRFAFFNV